MEMRFNYYYYYFDMQNAAKYNTCGITMRIKHTIGYKVRIIRSAFYPYIFDSLYFRSWVKRGPSPHFLVRKLPVDGPQVRSPHFTNAHGPFSYLSQKIGRTLHAQRDLRFYQVICGGLSTKFC